MLVEILQPGDKGNSYLEVLYKKGVLKNLSKLTGKHKKQLSGSVMSKRFS